MTMNPTADVVGDDRPVIHRAVVPVAIGSFGIASVWTVMGAHQIREAVVVLAVCTAVAVAVFGFLVPRALQRESAPRPALTMSILGLLLIVPAFWSGLPMILGAAGALLGYAGRNALSGSKGSIAAAALGALAVVGYLGSYVTDQFFLG